MLAHDNGMFGQASTTSNGEMDIFDVMKSVETMAAQLRNGVSEMRSAQTVNGGLKKSAPGSGIEVLQRHLDSLYTDVGPLKELAMNPAHLSDTIPTFEAYAMQIDKSITALTEEFGRYGFVSKGEFVGLFAYFLTFFFLSQFVVSFLFRFCFSFHSPFTPPSLTHPITLHP